MNLFSCLNATLCNLRNYTLLACNAVCGHPMGATCIFFVFQKRIKYDLQQQTVARLV